MGRGIGVSLNDFDWVLLGLVLAHCRSSACFEIYSATLHTKFVGFDRNQVLWLLGGHGGDVRHLA
jgi:rod shape determining protein RodA